MKPPIRLILLGLALALAGCRAAVPRHSLEGYGEARYVYVATEDPARLAASLVKEGDAVAAGQALFRLDPKRLQLSADSAEAQAVAARSRAALGGALDAAVARAEAAVQIAEQNFNRSQTLVSHEIAPRARYDADQAALEAARAELAQARAERSSARVEAEAVRSQADLARQRLDDLAVAAPAAGTIERIYRREGEVVTAGEPLASILPEVDGVRVKVFAPETLLVRLKLGQRVQLACDSCPKGLTGTIRFIASEPQFTPPVIYSQEERAKLVFLVEVAPDRAGVIRPGLPVDVAIAP